MDNTSFESDAVKEGSLCINAGGRLFFYAADGTGFFGEYMYDKSSKSMFPRELASPSLTERYASTITIDATSKIIYLTGGEQTVTCEQYDPYGNVWTSLPDFNVQRENHSSVVIAGRLYVFGGADANSRKINSVEYLDLVNGGPW